MRVKRTEYMKRMVTVAIFFLVNVWYMPLYSLADYSLSDDTVVVVAHGFGGAGGKDKWFVKAISYAFGIFNDNSRYAPDFPDAGGYFSKTVLYTRPAVIVLAQQLNDLVKDGKTAIHLVAHSCGGGIVINTLAKLISYESNKDYFEGTGITLADSQAIIAALKKGSINITSPLLAAERARFIMVAGTVLSGTTCIAACAGLYCVMSDNLKKIITSFLGSYVEGSRKEAISSVGTKFGFVGVGLGSYSALGKQLKKMYIKNGIRYIMPLVSRYNFDPCHPTPLESLEVLEDGLITRLHLCAYDEIIHFSPEDITKLRLKSVDLQIVDDTGHDTISNSLCNTIIMNYCAKKMLQEG
jgi:hypothetical protein